MLVSSIGYLDVAQCTCRDYRPQSQPMRKTVSEGFGHDTKAKMSDNDSGFASKFIEAFRSVFMQKDVDKASTYLSLIA